MFFSSVLPRSVTLRSSSPLDLPVGLLREADRAGARDALQSRGDIHAVAHQVAVALLDDIAQMDANAKLDALFWRHASIALDHALLHFDGAAHRVHNAAELDNGPIAGALNYAAMVHNVQGINEIAADRPKPRQGTIFISAGKPAVTDHVRDQDRRYFPGLAHRARVEAGGLARRSDLGMAAFPCCTDRYAATGNAGPVFGS